METIAEYLPMLPPHIARYPPLDSEHPFFTCCPSAIAMDVEELTPPLLFSNTWQDVLNIPPHPSRITHEPQ